MAGHSKWAQIKRQKAVTDKKRGALFTKLGNNITIAAREGGGDVNSNFALRLAVDTAKSANMPKDNIERAIKRGTGELGGGEIHELTYEAVVAGVGIIIKTLTDNKNRTAAEMKHILSKHNSSLANPGAVSWQFHEFGIIQIAKPSIDSETLVLKAIDLGALDVEEDEESFVIKTRREDLQRIKEQLEKEKILVEYAEIDLIPDTFIETDTETQKKVQNFLDALDDLQDVSGYYLTTKMTEV